MSEQTANASDDESNNMVVDSSYEAKSSSFNKKTHISSAKRANFLSTDRCSEDECDHYEVKINLKRQDYIKIVCISDTHNGHSKQSFSRRIEKMGGDLLIHAGDFGENGSKCEVDDAFKWLCSLNNFKYKIFISGNMDGIGLEKRNLWEKSREDRDLYSKKHNVIYLENDHCEVEGLTIYGSPYTPEFYGGFQYQRRSTDAKKLWSKIPESCDILVSHGPPSGILDKTSRGDRVGCHDLLEAINERPSIKAVVFGHVHHSYGFHKSNNKWFINAAQYNGIYDGDIRNVPIEMFLHRNNKSIDYVVRS